jgi:hypothetical protein
VSRLPSLGDAGPPPCARSCPRTLPMYYPTLSIAQPRPVRSRRRSSRVVRKKDKRLTLTAGETISEAGKG